MPDSIVNQTIREIEPLRADDTIETATRRVVESGLPALPAVDDDGKFAGIFGEREFLAALFPAYLKELGSSAMLRRTLDQVLEKRETCRVDPIREYLTTDHVVVKDEYSDTQLAEIFLHHRVLVVPIATEGRIHAVVTRNDFFRALAEKLEQRATD
jgi:CBS-domain-containing membrane protein